MAGGVRIKRDQPCCRVISGMQISTVLCIKGLYIKDIGHGPFLSVLKIIYEYMLIAGCIRICICQDSPIGDKRRMTVQR